jgi:methyl-galactoside transport system ATP-binding protein/inositol transport system ATP-binding protein
MQQATSLPYIKHERNKMSEYVLEMHGIIKEFPGVRALKGVDLKVRPGTVHALVGENGAGKSTLMKCLAGINHIDAGKIIYKGKEVKFHSILSAINAGISMIHQELSPVPLRTVRDNVWLGREPRKGPLIDHKKMYNDAVALFQQLDMNLDPSEIMGNLSVAKMQMVEIAKAVSYNSSIVIMDEPTSALTETEVVSLFRIIKDLKAKGVAIIYISHKLDEIFQICDEITVFRDGAVAGSNYAKNLTIDQMIAMMVGREMTEMFPKVICPIGDPVLKVENLSSGKAFQHVSFELRRGEILGFAGLVGAGRTEVVETIFGMRPKTGGEIYINGKKLAIKSPEDAIANKIALLTEDRRGNGIVGVLSVRDNIVLANLNKYGFPLKHKKIHADTQNYVQRLRVKTVDLESHIENLSGGNQQKALVARWLLTDPEILIVDEPTRGIDVGAKAEIHSLITKLAGEGKAVILISSELPEVLGMADRVLVMHEGKVTGIIDRKDANQELVLKYATGNIDNEGV